MGLIIGAFGQASNRVGIAFGRDTPRPSAPCFPILDLHTRGDGRPAQSGRVVGHVHREVVQGLKARHREVVEPNAVLLLRCIVQFDGDMTMLGAGFQQTASVCRRGLGQCERLQRAKSVCVKRVGHNAHLHFVARASGAGSIEAELQRGQVLEVRQDDIGVQRITRGGGNAQLVIGNATRIARACFDTPILRQSRKAVEVDVVRRCCGRAQRGERKLIRPFTIGVVYKASNLHRITCIWRN